MLQSNSVTYETHEVDDTHMDIMWTSAKHWHLSLHFICFDKDIPLHLRIQGHYHFYLSS